MFYYLRILLFPISIVYGVVTWLRNKCFDKGYLKSTTFNLPVICVGNLVVGGAGKTPFTEYLAWLLKDYKVAILSRGYGRKTKGFFIATQTDTAQTIGDEPLQYFNKFKNITVAVCEDRVLGIQKLAQNHDIIILDDAYQHRYVKAGFNALLFDFKTVTKTQFLLPTGNLRECFSGYRRANMVVITKTPENASTQEKEICKQKFRNHKVLEVVFSYIKYQNLRPLYLKSETQKSEIDKQTTVYLLTGIANSKPLIAHLNNLTAHVVHHQYADHHDFKPQDIVRLVADFEKDVATHKIIITTEKDAQRLQSEMFSGLWSHLPIFYLPIEIDFSPEDKKIVDKNIFDFVESFKIGKG